ncbi:phospholipase D-like domain-containing protein [Burkholderia glumae]|uniref:Cardiolipin synthase B n=1 Tax=Burkholderia glumae TaxID=337 RepID=A0AAQ0BTE1_BURGL|nr:phospholipase D-like domain-containing protein [Burkholderia glumae]ACR30137.1 Putative phospholipase [Burkholderia glumae BGR1]AJY66392.1 phospholipase D family protein [Burkholderia glumae LMG 2196 = ATCC 33617]KHJ63641.1 cardiolipin synthetase [Burkholderia glumae]MCM2482220.1 phospholipase D-like domain-containing protein [Burkholderia glumae]MCM2507637.1 phospholipase D-like domain-containing protein [Burkholderia glumae]
MSGGKRLRLTQLRDLFLQERGSSSRLAFSAGNTVTLRHGGAEFFPALVRRIDEASVSVLLETYIFCDDAAGRLVSDALLRAAGRGVHVRVITDGIGTARLPLFERWQAAGIEHRIYNRYLFGRLGFSRTHRKLACVDDAYAFCGGINIVDDYEQNGERLPFPRWDFAVELAGPAAADVRAAFEVQWYRVRMGHKRYAQYVPPTVTSEAFAARFRRWVRNHRWVKVGALRNVTEPSVAFVARDNVLNRRAIEKAYLAAIGRARQAVVLANPYFMPGRKLRRALTNAARRGVEVRVLIGRKEFVALDTAVPFLYHALLRAGVRVAEYDRTMLHGKVAVVDDSWATVGSSNLDALSLMLNNEANVVLVRHDAEIAALREAIDAAFADGREIDAARYAARPPLERLMNWLAYTAYRWSMKLLTVGGYD